MAKQFKWAGLLAVLGILGLASGTASAGMIDFSFKNEGWVTDGEGCGDNCLRLTTKGTASETAGIPGANSWNFAGVMEFGMTSWITADGDGTGTGLGWKFTDTSGNDHLWGSFSGDFVSIPILIGGGALDYIISGGSGLFAGATGWGESGMEFLLGHFTEKGVMHVTTPNSVPEPGMVTLLLAGFGMIAFMAYRRRSAQSKI